MEQPTLWQYFVTCITKKYATFEGRANRREFWGYVMFVLLYVVVWTCGAFILFPGDITICATINEKTYYLVKATNSEVGVLPFFYGMIELCVLITAFLPFLAVLTRRLHDIGTSGIWIIFALLPLIQVFVAPIVFVLSLLPGTRGPNHFGPQPETPTEITEDDHETI